MVFVFEGMNLSRSWHSVWIYKRSLFEIPHSLSINIMNPDLRELILNLNLSLSLLVYLLLLGCLTITMGVVYNAHMSS